MLPTHTTDWRESPTAWFAVLDRATREGDFERAAEAQRELARLGITVRWPMRPKQKKAVASSNLDHALRWPAGTAAELQASGSLTGTGPLDLVMFGARAASESQEVQK